MAPARAPCFRMRSWPANESTSMDRASSKEDATCMDFPPPASKPASGRHARHATSSSRASDAPSRTSNVARGAWRLSAASTPLPARPRSASPAFLSASRAPAVPAPRTGVDADETARMPSATSAAHASTPPPPNASPNLAGTRTGPAATRTAPSDLLVPRQTTRVEPLPASTSVTRSVRRRRCAAQTAAPARLNEPIVVGVNIMWRPERP
mmetsp:Transcript_17658/g.54320  ORF Transcript_17658/g.54320 Transcript_17658/m.54320 type:complete len:210 (+) Transcript_17658:442-1071(+)